MLQLLRARPRGLPPVVVARGPPLLSPCPASVRGSCDNSPPAAEQPQHWGGKGGSSLSPRFSSFTFPAAAAPAGPQELEQEDRA